MNATRLGKRERVVVRSTGHFHTAAENIHCGREELLSFIRRRKKNEVAIAPGMARASSIFSTFEFFSSPLTRRVTLATSAQTNPGCTDSLRDYISHTLRAPFLLEL